MGCRTDEQLDLGNYLCHGQCLPHQVAEPMNKEQREVSAPGEQKGTMIVFYLFYSSWFGGCDLLINSAHYISLGASIDWQEACKFDCPSPISTRHWRVARKFPLSWRLPSISSNPTTPKMLLENAESFFFSCWLLGLLGHSPCLFLFGHLGSGFHFGG